jgi:addiction module HigA family antidote
MKLRIPKNRAPTHPGEILLEDFLMPHDMSQTDLARRLGISFPRVNEIINGRRGVTPDTAIRLARLLGTTPEFWLNGQLEWDLWHALREIPQEELERIEPLAKVA